MRIAFLGAPSSWYLQDLVRAAGGHDLFPVAFCDLAAAVGPDGCQVTSGRTNLRDLDAILVRTMAPGTLEQVVFRMDVLGQLEAAGTVVVNPARAVEAAVDKYLATARLAAAGLRVPRTRVCQTVAEALEAFDELGRRVVIKPLFGSEGRGITRIEDPAIMLRAAKLLTQLGAVVYLQEFLPHDGCDLRLLVVGEKVLGIRRHNPGDWRTNVSRGAATEPLEVTARLAELAARSARAVGAVLAGVDLLPARDGDLYAIEVNAVPGWRAVARTLGVDVARLVLDHVEAAVAEKR